MESIDRPAPISKSQDPDMDPKQLFSTIGSALRILVIGFQIFIKQLVSFVLGLLLFIKRNLIWLLIGAVIGLIYGFYIRQTQGELYRSSLIVRTNFNSGRNLYESVDFFNSLINSSNLKELAGLLHINESEAASIKNLEAQPVKSELITAELYQSTFLDIESGRKPRTDTFWMRNVNYENFKEALTIYDYPVHEISVFSNDPIIFSKIQQGIIDRISGNDLLHRMHATNITLRKQEIDLLNASIKSLDTLKKVYNQRLAASLPEQQNSSLTILGGNHLTASPPELELYDKLLDLNEELRITTRKHLINDEIVQVYSPFSPVGTKDSFFILDISKFSLIGLAISFCIVSLISLFRFISSLEKQKMTSPVTNQ